MAESVIKILALCDYGSSTGFGTVASNIMQRLHKTGNYDITVIGINYDPTEQIDLERFPGRIIPAVTVSDMNNPDVYGRQKVLNELGKGIYDIFFSIQDTFILQTIMKQIIETNEAIQHKFSTIFYYPIDATPKKEWMERCVNLIDFPVPYTNYAREQSIKVFPEIESKLLEPIYHGTDLKDFYYIEDRQGVAQFRKSYFNDITKGKFLLMNLNRNQPRKDILRSFLVLQELKKRKRDVMLYLHMAHNDTGGNLLVLAEQFGFKINEDYILPSPKVFSVNQGLPIESVNLLYNCADAVITTTLGEGWGLSVTEAMATRTPVIAPDNTSLTEMMADNRGILVPSGANPSLWNQMFSNDNERIRPLMDVEKAADAVEQIMDGKLPDLDKALEFVKDNDWNKLAQKWIMVFNKAYEYSKQINNQPPAMNRAQRRAMKKQK